MTVTFTLDTGTEAFGQDYAGEVAAIMELLGVRDIRRIAGPCE